MVILENICKSFGNVNLLRHIRLELADEGITCLLGSSGCGKSTILRIAGSLELPDSGKVLIEKSSVGFVFQKNLLLPWLTVRENLRIALPRHCPEANSIIKESLSDVELHSDILNKMPRELSGGMAQRVSVLRAILRKPKILLMDEPFTSLDAITREHLQKMLMNVTSTRPCLFVTHDIDEAFRIACRICIVQNGTIASCFDHELFNTPNKQFELRLVLMELLTKR